MTAGKRETTNPVASHMNLYIVYKQHIKKHLFIPLQGVYFQKTDMLPTTIPLKLHDIKVDKSIISLFMSWVLSSPGPTRPYPDQDQSSKWPSPSHCPCTAAPLRSSSRPDLLAHFGEESNLVKSKS